MEMRKTEGSMPMPVTVSFVMPEIQRDKEGRDSLDPFSKPVLAKGEIHRLAAKTYYLFSPLRINHPF
jgi:hypothetical protein